MGRITSSIKRVLLVARRPRSDEYKEAIKVTGAIILFVGVIGFIYMAFGYLITGG